MYSPDNFYAITNSNYYSLGSEDYGHIGEFVEYDEVLAAMRRWAQDNKYFPELYFVSDHGNIDEHPTNYYPNLKG